ncbi:lytic transglycosylase domain-containing protein [Oleomonas cavernae]|uniref:Lytic transglycosylase domain-containing protein n=1 Tax=Oleomonas cavernae TaxID=2320859 RepID=A0A418WTR2_9PROT|nr:transglycosylase SLT domain-containing protein [Oleomonas cavernae]RJF94566.1 lytic transglycosylase domain-containing protein [Oleomonas cavernae]
MSMALPTEIANAVARETTYAGVPASVLRGIQSAAAKTGVDFKYLLAQAKLESGFDTAAKAATSTARGLYQFIEQTWLKVVKDHGDDHGMSELADAITQGADGRMKVKDAAARKQILALRDDPALAAAMGAEFARDNKEYLEGRLKREVGATDLYMAHFLGAGGASRFLGALERSPTSKAADLLPEAAAANRSIFYNKDGQARSVREVYRRFADKLENAGAVAEAAVTAQGTATVTAAVDVGRQVGRSVAGAAETLARMFGPSLSAHTVLTLAALPMPGDEKADSRVTIKNDTKKSA